MLVNALSQFRLTMSTITSRSLGPTAKGRTMHTIENGNERMRNTTAAPFANTKNLHATKINGWYFHLISVTICDLLLVCILLWNINLLKHWKIIPLNMKLKELGEEWKYLLIVPHDGSSTYSRTNGSEPKDEI